MRPLAAPSLLGLDKRDGGVGGHKSFGREEGGQESSSANSPFFLFGLQEDKGMKSSSDAIKW